MHQRRSTGSADNHICSTAAGKHVVAARADRLAAYPMLRGVVRYGKAGGIAISIAVAAMVLWLLWPVLENWAIPIAAAAGLLAGVVALSFVELVRPVR